MFGTIMMVRRTISQNLVEGVLFCFVRENGVSMYGISCETNQSYVFQQFAMND